MAKKKEEFVATESMVSEEMVDIVDPNEPLYDGGPSQAQIDGWKEEYGQVYLTELDDDDVYIWRILTRKEFKEIARLQDADPMYREERVCEKCILWPENYSVIVQDNSKAGAPTVLAEQIMEKSGFAAKTGPIQL